MLGKVNEAYGTFGKISDQYDAGRKGFPPAVLDFIFSQIATDNPFLLDLGCGTGISTRQLASRAGQVIGCDPDIQMALKAIQVRNEGIAYALGSAEHIPWSASAFDAVTCFSSFHWFDTERALQEILRVLKPWGMLAIVNKHDVGDLKQAYRALIRKYTGEILPNVKEAYQPLTQLIRYGLADVRDSSVEVVERYTVAEAIDYFQSVSLWNLIPEDLVAAAIKDLGAFCRSRANPAGILERHVMVTMITGRKAVH